MINAFILSVNGKESISLIANVILPPGGRFFKCKKQIFYKITSHLIMKWLTEINFLYEDD